MIQATDVRLRCRDCGREFVFTEGEQRFYEQMGFSHPTRCRQCRTVREKQSSQNTCAECGVEVPKGAAVYCESCVTRLQADSVTCSRCGVEQTNGATHYCETCLNQIQRDADRKVDKNKKTLSIMQSKLEMAEAENGGLQKSLYETKRYATELELKIKNLNQDLAKAYQLYVASGWLKPTLEGITQRLELLECSAQSTNHEVVMALEKMQASCDRLTLWDIIKRTFRRDK